MFDFREIAKLVELVQTNDIGELEVSRFFSRVKIRKRVAESSTEVMVPQEPVRVAPAPAPVAVESPPAEAASKEEPDQDLVAIRSPMVGTFYKSPAPDAASFTDVGETVKAGQVVCIIEAMKLMNEIESEVEGTVVKVLVENAQPVQYDQTLFLVRAS